MVARIVIGNRSGSAGDLKKRSGRGKVFQTFQMEPSHDPEHPNLARHQSDTNP